MNAPLFKVAVRNTNGDTNLFNLQHEDIPDHDCARTLVMAEVNGAAIKNKAHTYKGYRWNYADLA